MTRSGPPRDPHELHGVFREHEGPEVDVAGLLSGVRQRIEHRRKRRRTVGIVAVGMVTAIAAAIPIVVSSIPDQPSSPAGGSSQPAPTTTASAPPQDEQLDREELGSTEFAFTVAERPADYTMEYASTGPGWQLLRLFVPDSVQPQRTLDVHLFDPVLAGLGAPEPTGETRQIDSPSAGPFTAQVISLSQEGQSTGGVGWLTDNGLWLTVTSDSDSEIARQDVLDVAAQVDLGRHYPLTFPFQVGYVPEGFDLVGGSSGAPMPGGSTSLSFHDLSPLFIGSDSALTIRITNQAEVPEDAVVNTTVGNYQATITEDGYLSIYNVDGFLIDISVRPDFVDRIDEELLRQIGVRILVIPGAATDGSVWTDQPLG